MLVGSPFDGFRAFLERKPTFASGNVAKCYYCMHLLYKLHRCASNAAQPSHTGCGGRNGAWVMGGGHIFR